MAAEKRPIPTQSSGSLFTYLARATAMSMPATAMSAAVTRKPVDLFIVPATG